jgi:S1-C subfamily serine protease
MARKNLAVVLSAVVLVGCVTTQLPRTKLHSQWQMKVSGIYDGYLRNNGQKTRVVSKFAIGPGQQIYGEYVFEENGIAVKGAFSGCRTDDYGGVFCDWRDKYGTGKITVNFTSSLDGFNGAWGSTLVINQSNYWNGKLITSRNQSPKNKPKKALAPKVTEESKQVPSSNTMSSGSGFFVSKLGHIVTNQHVVKACKSLTVGDNANTQIKAEVVETDRRNDLALLKISSTEMASADTKSLIRKLGSTHTSNLGLKVVPLSSNGLLRSEDVELGETLLVAGYPYGDIFSNTVKVNKGIVSAIRGIGDDSGQFQMDAAVQPGNSGGPVYDENGNIVGVVVAQLNKLKMAKTIGSLPENVNFGIKASTVRSFLTSAGLPTKWSSRTVSMPTKDLAKIAKNQTVMVICER